MRKLTISILNVLVHPTILAHPESKAVPEGSDVTFTCSANGFPTPEITWKKGSAILTNSNSSLYSSDGRNITLANVKASNTANYSCVASNGNSVTSNAAQLTVQCKFFWCIARGLLLAKPSRQPPNSLVLSNLILNNLS